MSESEDPGESLQPLRRGKPWELSFAYAWLIGILVLIIASAAASIWLGIVDIQATFTFQADLGWALEYLVAGMVVLFLLFTFVQVIRITGIGFIAGLMATIARIAHNYELPESADMQGPASGSSGSEPQGEAGESGDQQ